MTADSQASRKQSDTASQVSKVTSTEAVAENQTQAVASSASTGATAGGAPADSAPSTQTAAPAPAIMSAAVEPASAAAPAPVAAAPVASAILSLVNGVFSPFAGDRPAAPPLTSPLDWAAAAVARREELTAAAIVSGPISVDPTLIFGNGVIYGDVGATSSGGSALIYTVVDGPTQGGKVTLNQTGTFSFLPDLSVVNSRGTEQFTVMVSETSALVALLEQVPLLGGFVQPVVLQLQQVPILGDILQPIIGYRVFAPIDVNIGSLVPVGDPVAFTTMITSFDGVQISTNFFPAIDLAAGDTAPTVLNGPGLGSNGNIDPTSIVGTLAFVPGIAPLRAAGYNYVSWDPRGEGDSGGVLQLDNPFFEGRDVQAIIDWVATRPETQLDAPGDPTLGMVGGSYGGGIQFVVAGIDPRVEAIVPAAAWNSLNQSLYPDAAFKSSWGTLLGIDLLQAGARINSQIYPAIILGDLLGFITETQQAILSSSGPTVLVSGITAATLIIQGTADGLFPLVQATINAELLNANGTPVDVIWACGGHGVCLDPPYPNQFAWLTESTLAWLDRYVNGNELVPTGPRFQWIDQNGDLYTSDLLPSDPAFNGEPLVFSGAGGFLPIVPLVGGSGPQTTAPDGITAPPLLVSVALASEAGLAINTDIPSPESTVEIVGSPELSMTYSGRGTSSHIYAQLVDETTGLVLGNIITPIPVTLDGRTHTVTVPLDQIAYTMTPTDSLKLQLVGFTTVYANFTQWGFINVDGVELALPTVAAGEFAPAAVGQAVVAA